MNESLIPKRRRDLQRQLENDYSALRASVCEERRLRSPLRRSGSCLCLFSICRREMFQRGRECLVVEFCGNHRIADAFEQYQA